MMTMGVASDIVYNEIDKNAAEWLRNLARSGHIPAGEVNEKSIREIRGPELARLRQFHTFAGIGGWPLALRIAGWPDEAEVWTGSCPCQPFSVAGKGDGFGDDRHLWPPFFSLIAERRPATVFGEQVDSQDSGPWLDRVQDDLESIGYRFAPLSLNACGIGAPHARQRLYWVADTKSPRRFGGGALEVESRQKPRGPGADFLQTAWPDGRGSRSTLTVSDVCAPSYGVPGRVGRLRAYGNAIVPQVAVEFIKAYIESMRGGA